MKIRITISKEQNEMMPTPEKRSEVKQAIASAIASFFKREWNIADADIVFAVEGFPLAAFWDEADEAYLIDGEHENKLKAEAN